jgi:hypothetical protein
MPSRSDDELDFLLSRGKLGGSQRARILEEAVAGSRGGFWTRWRAKLAWSAGGLVLAGGVAAMLMTLHAEEENGPSFRSKGSANAPLIVAFCLGAQLSACPAGSKLAFALEGGRDAGGFLTAYADPIGTGERVWYLTNEPAAEAQADGSRRLFTKGALIPEGQPRGSYRVHAIFSRHRVAREALVGLPAAQTLAKADFDLVVSP